MSEREAHVTETINKMNSLFQLLVPTFLSPSQASSPFKLPAIPNKEFIQKTGLGSQSYSLTVSVPTAPEVPLETEENEVLYGELRECVKLLLDHLQPMVLKWLSCFTRTEGGAVGFFFPLNSDFFLFVCKVCVY
jgi:hypothetical protein